MWTTWLCNIFAKSTKHGQLNVEWPNATNTLLNFGNSSAWSCNAIFAMARSKVTDMVFFLHYSAIICALFRVSAITATEVGDWFICGRYHTFWILFEFGMCLEFQPTHIGVSAGQKQNSIIHSLNVVKVGHKFLLPVGNNLNSFVKFRRLPGGHTCHIKRDTCNILICLRNIVILRKSFWKS